MVNTGCPTGVAAYGMHTHIPTLYINLAYQCLYLDKTRPSHETDLCPATTLHRSTTAYPSQWLLFSYLWSTSTYSLLMCCYCSWNITFGHNNKRIYNTEIFQIIHNYTYSLSYGVEALGLGGCCLNNRVV